MAKVRVYEFAKEHGLESKDVLKKLQDMGEYVRSASSTIEPPVVRRLTEKLKASESAPEAPAPAKKSAAPAAKPTAAPKPAGAPRP
ncbi:MAG TPA: hypothetical protein GXZ45_07555, partial [Propionibacterium sp.]|nr:hypothetical protein [Propionibacterium sp.]